MTSGTLCQTFIDRAFILNVTFLMTPASVAASGAACSEEPVFSSVYTPGGTGQPSSQPSSHPTSSPSVPPGLRRKKLVSSGFIGFLTVVCLIWFLRFFPSLLATIKKKKEKICHLYDILVVINDEEEAILENIRHEDITFFRRTNVEESSKSLKWTMNSTSDVLEQRFEVQFLDHYDLLGESGPSEEDKEGVGHAIKGEKLVTKEMYVHEPELQCGMIIRVKPAYQVEEELDGTVKSPMGHDFSGPSRENSVRDGLHIRDDSSNSLGSSISESTRVKR